jgi:hypothetical protein
VRCMTAGSVGMHGKRERARMRLRGGLTRRQLRATRASDVQPFGAPAMALSWRRGTMVETDRIETIADGVAGRCPQPERFAGRHVTTILCGSNVGPADFARWVLEPATRAPRRAAWHKSDRHPGHRWPLARPELTAELDDLRAPTAGQHRRSQSPTRAGVCEPAGQTPPAGPSRQSRPRGLSRLLPRGGRSSSCPPAALPAGRGRRRGPGRNPARHPSSRSTSSSQSVWALTMRRARRWLRSR